MKTVKFTSWQDGEFFIGLLNEYPGYQTQGLSKEELAENSKDLLVDLESSKRPDHLEFDLIPGIPVPGRTHCTGPLCREISL